jgi:3-(methylthio)propanoyl-CoA dehydrogenase
MSYRAPMTDMLFILKHVGELERLNQLPGLQDYRLDLAQSVLEEAARFASGVLEPINRTGDVKGAQFQSGTVTTPIGWREAYQQFCDHGWLGLTLPDACGGQGLPEVIATPAKEMWLSANLSFTMLQALAQGGSEILLAQGSEEQKQRYLQKMVTGRWSVAMALTEPNAGSDLAALTTRATPITEGRYRIKGQKIFITYGDHDLAENIVHLVLARIDGAPAGNKGISLFVVPKYRINEAGQLSGANDVRCIGIEDKLGLHGSPTCTMVYGEQNDCVGELIGTENHGLKAMFILMNEARLSTGLQGVALAEMARQKAQGYALERAQGREPLSGQNPAFIVDHPDVKRLLLTIQSQVTALRSLAIQIAAAIDEAKALVDDPVRSAELKAQAALLTPVFKAHATETGNRLISDAIQVYGGIGFVEDTGIAQLLRDAKITTLYEGTTGIQAKDLLFRKIQKDGGKALEHLLSNIQSCIEKISHGTLQITVAQPMTDALNQFRAMVAGVLKNDSDRQYGIHAGATIFLQALGILCGGWQLAKLAAAAGSDSNSNSRFRENLIAQAEFYCAHIIPMINSCKLTFEFSERGLQHYQFT